MTERPHIFRWILIFTAFAFWVFLLLACGSFSTGDWPSHDVYPYPPVRNLCGPVGSLLAYYCFMVVGQGIYPILLATGVGLVLVCVRGRVADLWLRAIGLAIVAVAFAAAIQQVNPGSHDGFPEGNGGLLGIAAGKFLVQHFNSMGAMLVLLTSLLVGLLLAADELVLRAPKLAVQTYGKVQEKSAGLGGLQRVMPGIFSRLGRRSPTDETDDETTESTDTLTLKPRPGATTLFDEDELPADDKKVLLNRHNLDGTELELTYAHDAEPESTVNGSALKEVDAGPAEAVVIPPPAVQEKVEPVINNLAAPTGPVEAGTGATALAPATPPAVTAPEQPKPETAPATTVGGANAGEIVVRNASAARARVADTPPAPKELGDYRLPAWDFLADAEHGFAEQQEKYVREKADVLTQTLREFGIDASVVAIDTGPVITMYELMIPSGMKVASITQLTNDIRRALKAVGEIRIVAPVPGKDTVGIEVPNPQKEKVRLKDLFSLAPDARNKMAIPIYLGKDASGEALVTDLTKMPHCLIAGTTGSGKSVCINTIVMSIMYHQRPDHVKLILIDPKVVELKPFSEIPHLMCPPINDPNKAPSVLEWLCTKMDERYELLAEAGVRQIGDYNKLTREQLVEIFQPATEEEEAKIPKFMPYIVVVIDELADLMMQSGKEVEASIVRLAQKSRAVGIHVILATQRPQANVVTGLIKSNMPSRIAFRVQSRMDSRIVLDQNGAELLLGQGDMLFLPPGAAKPIRSQGTFIDDIEVRQSVKLVKGLAEAQYEPELVQIRQVRSDSEFEHDDLYDDAVKVVIETKRGSVSLLQRRLSIGYARASRLIERMAATGILGEYKGSQSREVMFTLEEWEAAKAQMQKDQDEGMTV